LLIAQGQVSMGALIAAVILTGRALAPLAQLAQMLTRLNQARSSYRSLDALMQAGSERPKGQNFISRPRLGGGSPSRTFISPIPANWSKPSKASASASSRVRGWPFWAASGRANPLSRG